MATLTATLRPNASSDSAGWTCRPDGTDEDYHLFVNDDSDLTYLDKDNNIESGNNTFQMDTFTVPVGSTIDSVQPFVRARLGGSTSGIQILMDTTGTGSFGLESSTAFDDVDFTTVGYSVEPTMPSGAAWTQTGLNSLSVLVGCDDAGDSAGIDIADVWMVVTYTVSAPTASVTAPTAAQVVSTGGPTLTVTWDYSQAQSLAQSHYRVEILNAALTTTYYDTGTVSSAVETLAINAVDAGIPTDTSGSALKVRVTVTSSTGGDSTTSAAVAFDVQWGVVTCTIDEPEDGATVTTTSITAEWTFASTRAKTQGHYRVRLLAESSGIVFYDSGWVAGTDASLVVPVTLTDNSRYRLGVQLKNSEGIAS